MSMTDPIADLLTRIRNAQTAKHDTLRVPASRIKEAIVKILMQEGYVGGYVRVPESPQDILDIQLKYGRDGQAAIEGIERESKPGRRVYVRAQEIPRVRYGLGVAIVSTSAGLMADHIARKKNMGGELLCTVW